MIRCDIRNCARPEYNFGLCYMHFQRFFAEPQTPAPSEPRPCLYCGTEFSNRRPDALYCTKACGAAQGMVKNCYDLEGADIRRMLEEQKFECGICTTPINLQTKHIDHCHTTGRIRGLLCRSCNIGLGCFNDNPHALNGAIAYLDRYHPKTEATKSAHRVSTPARIAQPVR